MEVTGTVIKKLEKRFGESKAGKPWASQDLVINTGAQYNSTLCIEFFGDEKVKILDNINVGDDVKVGLNVFSREYNDKYYATIQAWKIEKLNSLLGVDEEVVQQHQKETKVISVDGDGLSLDVIDSKDADDDLPF